MRLGLGFAILALSASAALAQEPGMTLQNPDELKWREAPASMPKGAEVVVLSGDPMKEGPFTMRLKFPANYRVAPHTHPSTETVTVLMGDLSVGMGDKFDESKAKKLTAGAFFTMPKGMQHYAWSASGTVIQVSAQGPFGITYVNPADDPSKTQ